MNLKHINNVYFIGIGGIGMSALARYFVAKGLHVGGYDKTKTEITDALENLNITIHFEDDIRLIDDRFLNPKDVLVVYTPAIPNSHNELNYFKSNGLSFKTFFSSWRNYKTNILFSSSWNTWKNNYNKYFRSFIESGM